MILWDFARIGPDGTEIQHFLTGDLVHFGHIEASILQLNCFITR